ncbi:MAG: type II toxin-antitoxin system MqsA family antitoxin [Gemmatimonadetes bacterium]|nr:type II toxin-antitoxin system MqsA family antitoxin [Gemmatimonadota bacterium]
MPNSVDLTDSTHNCGGFFRLVTEVRDVTLGQSRVPVNESFFRCDLCAEERQTLEQLGNARRAAAETARVRDRLLAPSEMRRIREERLGLTQAQLESALGLGEKTVVRWETGRVLQPKATDDLLRLLDRDPSALSFLAAHNGSEEVRAVAEVVSSASDEKDEETEVKVNREVGQAGPQQVTIPRRCLSDLQGLANAEGISVESYVVWTLAERVSEGRVERLLGPQMTSMRTQLEGILASLDSAWQRPKRPMSFSRRSNKVNHNVEIVRNREPYAQSA